MRNITKFEFKCLKWFKNIFCVYTISFLGLVAWYIYKNGFDGYKGTSSFLILMFIVYVIVAWMFTNFIYNHNGKNINTFELKIILFNYVQIMFSPFIYVSVVNYQDLKNLIISFTILLVIIFGRHLVIKTEQRKQKNKKNDE